MMDDCIADLPRCLRYFDHIEVEERVKKCICADTKYWDEGYDCMEALKSCSLEG